MKTEELKEKVAKYLVRMMWTGAELGIGNSSLRDMTEEQYYKLNKKDWNNRAQGLIELISPPPPAQEQYNLLIDALTDLIYNDPHQWSTRGCQTCRAISSIIKKPFGCYQYAEQKKKVIQPPKGE